MGVSAAVASGDTFASDRQQRHGFPLAPWILWQVSAFIRWCVRVFAATRGNHYYRRLAARRIRTVPDGTEDVRRQALRRLGGVSWPLPVVFDAICAGFTLLGLAIGGKI